ALTSAAGDDPHQARIELETNDANNYLASSMGSQAVEKIRSSVTTPLGLLRALTSAAGDDPHQARIELETNDANNYLASSMGS
ncbi:hypothetical protein CTI14_67205, partial [Methylobacterium radiotolerans]